MFCPRCHRRFDDNDHRFCAYDGERLVTTPDLANIPHKPTAETGTVLNDRYEVRGLIGRGGMARIYLAVDKRSREPVAVKILDSLHLRTPGARDRFDREARIANVVTHPNIVKVLDTGQRADGVPFMGPYCFTFDQAVLKATDVHNKKATEGQETLTQL